MNWRNISIGAIAAVLPLFAVSARADMYTFVDRNGVTHVTNVPSDSRYRLWFRDGRAPQPAGDRRPSRSKYDALIDAAARTHNIERALLHAIIAVESGYDARAVSPKGAIGLMQLLPQTAGRYGVKDLFDPAQNLHAGAAYLRDLLARFNSDLRLALAAYNAGEGAIAKYGNQVPPYPETVSYLPKVLERYQQLRARM